MRVEMEEIPATGPSESGDTATPDVRDYEEKQSGVVICMFNREVINFSLYGKALPSSECACKHLQYYVHNGSMEYYENPS